MSENQTSGGSSGSSTTSGGTSGGSTSGGTSGGTSGNQSRRSRKRVAVKIVAKEHYPKVNNQPIPRAKDHFVAVTEAFAQAFGLQAQTAALDPIQITKDSKTFWRIPGQPGFYSDSYTFWKLESGKKKGYRAPVGGAPLYAVIKAAKSLTGCVGVTTNRGVSYSWTSSSGSSSGGN